MHEAKKSISTSHFQNSLETWYMKTTKHRFIRISFILFFFWNRFPKQYYSSNFQLTVQSSLWWLMVQILHYLFGTIKEGMLPCSLTTNYNHREHLTWLSPFFQYVLTWVMMCVAPQINYTANNKWKVLQLLHWIFPLFLQVTINQKKVHLSVPLLPKKAWSKKVCYKS